MELVQAFLRPYRAESDLHAFPGASPQALVFRPFQGTRSPIHRYADTPISLLLCFVLIIFACSPCAAQSASSTDPASQPAQTSQPAQASPARSDCPAGSDASAQAVQPFRPTQPAGSPEPCFFSFCEFICFYSIAERNDQPHQSPCATRCSYQRGRGRIDQNG